MAEEKVDKLERLMNLVAVLLDTMRPLSAEELRDQVPGYPESGTTFHRAFERDKEDLRELGVPLVVEPIPGIDPPCIVELSMPGICPDSSCVAVSDAAWPPCSWPPPMTTPFFFASSYAAALREATESRPPQAVMRSAATSAALPRALLV